MEDRNLSNMDSGPIRYWQSMSIQYGNWTAFDVGAPSGSSMESGQNVDIDCQDGDSKKKSRNTIFIMPKLYYEPTEHF